MTTDYKIGKLVVEELAWFEWRGYRLAIHKPVTAKGYRATRGWQVSLDGVPIQHLKGADRQGAIDEFVRLTADKIEQADTKILMAECISTQKAEWKLT